MDSRNVLFDKALKLRNDFNYNNGTNNLLDDITKNNNNHDGLTVDHEYLLREIIQQPTALYCGEKPDDMIEKACFCFVHIVKHPRNLWKKHCLNLKLNLDARLKAPVIGQNMRADKVLENIEAEGRKTTPSDEWEDAFRWLQMTLPYVCNDQANLSEKINYGDAVQEVKSAANIFQQWNGPDKPLRPCQLAAILLNVYGVKTGTKLLIEVKTGEGKTFVCGISAAVVAKLFNDGPAIILTSSLDRVNDDKNSTKKLMELILGGGKTPITASELKPGENNGAGRVVYGQVSDIQKIVVDMLTQNNPKTLHSFLRTCNFFLDEADYVLVEQAESLLYIASPCPTYYALHSTYFQIQYRIDYGGEYNQVKARIAIQEKAKKLRRLILSHSLFCWLNQLLYHNTRFQPTM